MRKIQNRRLNNIDVTAGSWRSRFAKGVKRINWGLLTLALPGLCFLVAFYIVPMIGMVLPFKSIDYTKGVFGGDWVGLKNFRYFFESSAAYLTTRNALLLNLMFISVTLAVSLTLAILLYQLSKGFVKVFQTGIFIPNFISWVTASYVLFALLSPTLGVIPRLLESLGTEAPNFYFEPRFWPWILLICFLWKNVGYMTLLFYTSTLGIDPTFYEASSLEGATKLQQAFYITLPCLMPVIVLFTLLQVGRIFFSDFGLFYFMPKDSGALFSVTDVIDTYVFRALRVTGDVGMASAAALYQAVMGLALVLISNLAVRRYNRDYSIL